MHPDPGTLVRLSDGRLAEREAAGVREHVQRCEECGKKMRTLDRFAAEIDGAWTHKRLDEVAASAHWPTREELVDYYLEDTASAESRAEIAGHLRNCAACRAILEDLARGSAELEREDPLRQPLPTADAPAMGWREAVRSLMRPSAWPAWSLAAAAGMALFVMGFLLRPMLWAPAPTGPVGPMAEFQKPPLERKADGTLVLGIGAIGARPEARALLERALDYYEAPDFADRALPSLEQAVQIDPSFEQARFWLGICYLTKGNTASAVRQLEEAARLAPGNVTYHYYLVWAYLKAGHYRKALEEQTRMIGRQ